MRAAETYEDAAALFYSTVGAWVERENEAAPLVF